MGLQTVEVAANALVLRSLRFQLLSQRLDFRTVSFFAAETLGESCEPLSFLSFLGFEALHLLLELLVSRLGFKQLFLEEVELWVVSFGGFDFGAALSFFGVGFIESGGGESSPGFLEFLLQFGDGVPE